MQEATHGIFAFALDNYDIELEITSHASNLVLQILRAQSTLNINVTQWNVYHTGTNALPAHSDTCLRMDGAGIALLGKGLHCFYSEVRITRQLNGDRKTVANLSLRLSLAYLHRFGNCFRCINNSW